LIVHSYVCSTEGERREEKKSFNGNCCENVESEGSFPVEGTVVTEFP
jgi:hypothetical protein